MVSKFCNKVLSTNIVMLNGLLDRRVLDAKILLVLFCCLLIFSCRQHRSRTIASVYTYISPHYDLTQLQITSDTLHFLLNEDTYNAIKSFNVFSEDGVEYISFYDQRSASINIYHFTSQKMVTKILLKKFLPGGRLYKTTAYVKSFDSILITNKKTLYLCDSAGNIRTSVNFLEKPAFAYACFSHTTPPVFKGSIFYVGVRPFANATSFKSLKEWGMLYEFNIQKGHAELHYSYPELYYENIYGYHLIDYSYCYNHRGKFVFSFAADSIIYETDLADYHKAYYGKSRFQMGGIPSVRKEDIIGNQDGSTRIYLTRDSYEAIYFDHYRKRYLRVAKSKISEYDYESKNQKKPQRIIIFDEHFKIIGESAIDNGISLNSMFFTQNGSLFARTKGRDEYALHFVRLAYLENTEMESQLTRNEATNKYY